MPQVGFKVAGGVEAMSGGKNTYNKGSFSLSDPAGWVMVWWVLSIILIAMVFFSL